MLSIKNGSKTTHRDAALQIQSCIRYAHTILIGKPKWRSTGRPERGWEENIKTYF
jgi:hypothetical protein